MKQEKELLRKQMNLLAEQSRGAMTEDDLAVLSSAMCKTYRELVRDDLVLLIAILSAVALNSLACLVVHIQKTFGRNV